MKDLLIYISLFLSVLASGSVVLLFKRIDEKNIKLLLSFGGAFLLSISFLHLIPEVYASETHYIGIYILLGFLLQLILELFSQGIEHGHVHYHHEGEKKFPITLMIGLCIHAFIEGIPLEHEVHAFGEHHSHNPDQGSNSLLIGVILHNIPVSIALISMFLHAGISKSRSFIWLMLFAVMGPLGALIAHIAGPGIQREMVNFFDISLAIVIGMILHISTTILFETNAGHRFNLVKLATILLGSAVAFLNL